MDLSNLLDDGFTPAALNPTIGTGARAAGTIVGGLLTFPVARATDARVVISGLIVGIKTALIPSLTLVLFNADPTATTKTDSSAYALAAGDWNKVIKAIRFSDYLASWISHGTPRTIDADNLGIVAAPVSGTKNVLGLLIDNTGVTFAAANDVFIALRGSQIG